MIPVEKPGVVTDGDSVSIRMNNTPLPAFIITSLPRSSIATAKRRERDGTAMSSRNPSVHSDVCHFQGRP